MSRMKKVWSIVIALVMALTIFIVPNFGLAYAEDETVPEDAVKVDGELGAMALLAPGKPSINVSATENSLTFNWETVDKIDNATGYEVSVIGAEEGWTDFGERNSYTKDNLAAGESFTIWVRAYNKADGEETVYSAVVEATGKTTTPAVMPTKPGKPSFSPAEPALNNIRFRWQAVDDVDGYAYSRYYNTLGNGYFMDIYQYQTYKWVNLPQQTTKKFRVIAYRNIPEGIDEQEAIEAGAIKLNPEGKLVMPSDVSIMSATTLTRECTVKTKYDRGYKYVYYDQSGTWRGDSYSMWNTIKNKKSKTKYLIALDTNRNNVVVYKGKKGNWKPIKHFVCATGMEGHRTPRGDYKIKSKKPKFHTGDKVGKKVVRAKFTCWYATRFKGAVFFHSTLYYLNSKSRHAARHVGTHCSHGCIRLEIANARWIYKNCGKGTAVISRYYGKSCSYGNYYVSKKPY